MNFRSFVDSFRSVWGALSALALALAMTLNSTALVPPWPDESGTSATATAAMGCVLGVTLGYYLPVASKRWRRVLGVLGVCLALALLIAYIYLLGIRTVSVPQTVEGHSVLRRVVVGTAVRDPADFEKTPAELVLLYGFGGEAWTPRSLANARICLLTSYVGFFVTLTLALGLLQRDQASHAPAGNTEKGEF
jgi:hypothetical protein